MNRLRTLFLCLVLALAPAAHAQQTPAPAAQPQASAAAHVPVPKPSAKAVRYHRSGNVLWVIGNLWGFLVPAVILFSGLSARMRDAARRVGRNWFFTLVLYGVMFSLLTWILDLPLAYYSGFVREHAYGLSNQGFGKWFGDAAKALGVGLAVLAATLWIPYLLLKKSPRRWWLYTAMAVIPLIVAGQWLSPIFIDPLYNDFGPMKNKQLEAQILDTARRAGIEGGRVFEVNKSVDTEAVNAYVTGFGGSKRIVLWDTLLRKLDSREVIFVMGHEMGHYVLKHVFMMLGVISLLILLCLYAVHASAGWLIGRYRERFGFDQLSDVASYPLLILVFGVVSFLATPALYAVTRHSEHEADRFGLELTHDNHSAATAFAKLQAENLAVPYPGTLYKVFRASHPVLGERIEFANTYRPWETGGEQRYADRFRR
ncbi:MAG TPA: M48 family metallopeptidase [Longimicrobium sp.]|jgi:Zn-dependent protease with chaperone function